AAVAQSLVGGQGGSLANVTCYVSHAMHPRVTVTIQRAGLPTFFGRIWGAGAGSVSATAKAEAFNPSGGSVNIAVGSVKPWLINNDCVPGPCTGLPGPFYFTPATYGIVPGATFIGTQVTF